MAARKNVYPDQNTVERIRATIETGQLVKRLMCHINGTVELNKSQVSAALGLLKKTLPDLTSVEQTSEVTHHYVARVPNPAKTVDEWQKQHEPPPQTLQ